MLLTLKTPLLAITQDELEYLRTKIAQLKAEKKKRKIDLSKSQKVQENKVISEHWASDAAKAKLKSTAHSSNLYATVKQYGPMLMDSSLKPTGSRPKSLMKGDTKSDTKSQAKRTRDEQTHPVSADYKTYKTDLRLLEQDLRVCLKCFKSRANAQRKKPFFSSPVPSDPPLTA